MTEDPTTAIEAATFRRLCQHLMHDRPEVQNIELMLLAGFCRNCLADWYRDAAEAHASTISRDQAREAVYGEPFPTWKAKHQREASPAQRDAFEAMQRGRANASDGDRNPRQ